MKNRFLILILLNAVYFIIPLEANDFPDSSVDGDKSKNSRQVRDLDFADPRSALSTSELGSRFRSKRDKEQINAHVLKAQQNSLESASESVEAAEKSLEASKEAEEAMNAVGQTNTDSVNSDIEQQPQSENEIETQESSGESNSEAESSLPINESNNINGESSMQLTQILDDINGESNEEIDDYHEETNQIEEEPDAMSAVASNSAEAPASTIAPSSSEDTSKDKNCELSSSTDKDGHLQKLITESSDLTKELRGVFDALVQREKQLVEEMEHLKTALADALTIFKKSDTGSMNMQSNDTKKRFRRGHLVQESPYKACVYIESSPDSADTSYDHSHQYDSHQQHGEGKNSEVYPPEAIIHETFAADANEVPSENEQTGQEEEESKEGTKSVDEKGGNEHNKTVSENENKDSHLTSGEGESGDDIDLKKVFWVKLPAEVNNEDVRKKAEKVLAEVNEEGKDVLIIPVSKGFSSGKELSAGLMKAIMPSNRYRKRRNGANIAKVKVTKL